MDDPDSVELTHSRLVPRDAAQKPRRWLDASERVMLSP
jgi:hypothetical protein